MKLRELSEAPYQGYGLEGKPEWFDRAVQMKLDDPSITLNQIAKQIGVSQHSVTYWLIGYESPGHGSKLKRPSDSFPFKREDFMKYRGGKPPWYDQALPVSYTHLTLPTTPYV